MSGVSSCRTLGTYISTYYHQVLELLSIQQLAIVQVHLY